VNLKFKNLFFFLKIFKESLNNNIYKIKINNSDDSKVKPKISQEDKILLKQE
jgi:hypothetical protein